MRYEEEFNKQLAKQMKMYRENQPNHIPVYAMKYKNASKYLIEDLKEPIALYPKKFKLQTVYQKIKQQSIQYAKQKYKNDKKVKQLADKFDIENFYLYTISIQESQSQKNKKLKGQFIKLDLQMTFQEAFEKYGRQNVLTIVYTDLEQLKNIWDKNNTPITEKTLICIALFIVLLIVIPFFMGNEPNKLQLQESNSEILSSHSIETTQSAKQQQ